MAQACRLHQGRCPTHASSPAACTFANYHFTEDSHVGAAAPGDDVFCVWIHARCCKYQPRSDHPCRAGSREFLLLTDARTPRSCKSWRALQSAHTVPSRDNHRNGVCAHSLRRTVEQHLPRLFLRAASEAFVFSSAAAAVEALHGMLADAEPPVAVLHVL